MTTLQDGDVTQWDFDGQPDMLWEMNYEVGNDECRHTLPAGWEFAGPTEQDPRADRRWWPTTYTYLDRNLRKRYVSQEPFCDHVALGSFMQKVQGRLPEHLHPFYVWAMRPGQDKPDVIFANPEGALAFDGGD